MPTVSELWKANQKRQITEEAFVEVSYRISDPEITGAAAAANNGEELFLSNMSDLIDEVDYDMTSYATLEPDFWLLDGKSKITVPESGKYEYSGFTSKSLCNINGVFNPGLRISVQFDKPVRILPGLTITWGAADGDYPTKFKVTTDAAKGKALTVTGNTDVISVLEFPMENLSKIDIDITGWSRGHRRARIGKLFLGVIKTYTKDDLLNFSCSQTIDPLSLTLPKYEVSFALDNRG